MVQRNDARVARFLSLRWLLRLAGAGFIGFVILQFIRPTLTDPPVTADLQAPAAVKQVLLTTGCMNCHSNETKLPWFDEVVPAYWLVVRDVRRGRMHLNFSTFGKLAPAAQRGFLYESVSDMQVGYMPPRNYLLVHPAARVTPEELATLKAWLNATNPSRAATPAQVAASDAEYQKWSAGALHKNDVTPALNGLAFPADYADWKPVSFTDRFDNRTFRIILGNDTAQKAIADQQTHPWPDGAAFAKIALAQQDDGKGAVTAGSFGQVEFMVKDRAKYAGTDGWGFGRWKTTDLVPYGKTKFFANECVSCHAPMAANDHVFTMPIRGNSASDEVFNGLAALPADLPVPPLQWRVITTSLDRAQGTISALFGNDLAITHVRTEAQGPWPPRRAGGAGDVEAAGRQALVRRAHSRCAHVLGNGDGRAARDARRAGRLRLRVVCCFAGRIAGEAGGRSGDLVGARVRYHGPARGRAALRVAAAVPAAVRGEHVSATDRRWDSGGYHRGGEAASLFRTFFPAGVIGPMTAYLRR